MSWIYYSDYKKRIWDFKYQDTTVHLLLSVHKRKYVHDYTRITWSAAKYRGVKFKLEIAHTLKPNYADIFSKLRISLAYGLNPAARDATDRIMGITKDNLHTIHNVVRTNKPV